jgi:hypothetical protein
MSMMARRDAIINRPLLASACPVPEAWPTASDGTGLAHIGGEADGHDAAALPFKGTAPCPSETGTSRAALIGGTVSLTRSAAASTPRTTVAKNSENVDGHPLAIVFSGRKTKPFFFFDIFRRYLICMGGA